MAQLCEATALVKEFNEETGNWEAIKDDNGDWVRRPCRAYAMKGFTTCWTHNTPERYAKRIAKSRKLGSLLSQMDIPDHNPMDGLLEAVRYSGAMVRTLAVLVAQLSEEPELIVGFDGIPLDKGGGMWGLDRFGEQAPHVLMKLYDQWMDRYTRSCRMAVEAGLDERLVRNAEFTSQVMVQAFQRALEMVTSLTPDQRTELGMAMAQSVRQLGSGSGDKHEARRLG